jgi:hypothetical protein
VTIELHPDFSDMLRELSAAGADFLLVGGYAVGAWGHIRATKDLDIFVRPSSVNAPKVYAALARFGAPLHDLAVADLAEPGLVFQIGVPPRRIDVITAIEGVTFDEACVERRILDVGAVRVPLIGLAALLKNKRSVGRPEDQRDVRELEKVHDLSPAPAQPRRRPAKKAKARAKKGR